MRIFGLVLVLVSIVSSVTEGGVLIQHSQGELWTNAQVYAYGTLCQEHVLLDSLATTEITCALESESATAESSTSLAISTNSNNTLITIRVLADAAVSGFDPTPESSAPFAGCSGWASLGFLVIGEPMQVTMSIVGIETDARQSPIPSRISAYLSTSNGGITSLGGQTTQTGILTGTIQPGASGQVYIEFEDVISEAVFPGDAFAHLELTLSFEPVGCGASNAASDPIRWTNPAGGSYLVANNWDPATIPVHDCQRSDTAIFDLNSSTPITINAANATAGGWRVLNGSYNVTGPAELFFASPTPDPSLEIYNGGKLTLTGGALLGEDAAIGETVGLPGSSMKVQNPGAEWNAASIGVGHGSLEVSAGGALVASELRIATQSGGTATMKVEGVSGESRSNASVYGRLSIGAAGSAIVEIVDGARVFPDEVWIGEHSNGTVLIKGSSNPDDPLDTGSYALLASSGFLFVGGDAQGLGTLTVEKGGAVIGKPVAVRASGSARGRLIVDGQGEFATVNAHAFFSVLGSELLEVEVKNGGRILAESIRIGGQVPPDGQAVADVTIRGGATQLEQHLQTFLSTKDFPASPEGVGLTTVGKSGPGQLNILQGAYAHLHGGLVIGDQAQGIMIVSSQGAPAGQTSSVEVTGTTHIGVGAPGTLQLGDGAIINTFGDMTVGLGASGTITLNNDAALNVNGTLKVGHGEMGTLSALAGSAVDCTTLVIGGGGVVSNVTFTSSDLHVYGNAQVGTGPGIAEIQLNDSSTTMTIDGTLTIGGPGVGRVGLTGGATIQGTGNIVINPGGFLDGTGGIELCSVCTINNGGTVSPGNSPGTLNIGGNYEQTSTGMLVIEYAGTKPGEFDVLHVAGQATLGGTLEIHFVDGFSPPDPDVFLGSQGFVEADGGVSGEFEPRLYVYPDHFADFDDDGDKDLRDVASFANCFAESGTLSEECLRADWERDGNIANREIWELGSRLTGPE